MKIKCSGGNVNRGRFFLLALLLIYIIYEPEFSTLFLGIHSYYVNVIIMVSLIFLNMRKFITMEKRLFYFCIITISCAFYTMFITAISGNEIRFFQHIYVIFQAFAIYLIIKYIDKHFENPYITKIKLTEVIILIEFLVCILMILIKPFKQLAVSLYYAGLPGFSLNEYVVSKRIYGIFGDYTFKCQVINGIFAFFFIALVFKTREKKYYIYAILALIISILNGRTGILIFVILFAEFFALSIFSEKRKIAKKLGILIRVVGIFFMAVLAVYLFSPETFVFLRNMLYNFLGLDAGNDNNLKIIANSFVIPTGLKLWFGAGEVYYGSKTDIGYCNDIGLVGIIVTVIEYANVIWFLKPAKKEFFVRVVYICLICGLLITNIKGVCMRSGSVVIGILWMRMVLESGYGLQQIEDNRGW